MKQVVKITLFFIVAILVSSPSWAQKRSKKKADRDTHQWRYEIECAGTGSYGTYLVKVWSFSKHPHVATEQAKKNAIHGVLYKGFAGQGGCRSQKPLVQEKKEEHEKILKEFFASGGDYLRFVTAANNGSVGPGDIIKMKRKEYKVGVVISVKKDELRRYMENKGIVKKLGHGF